MTTEKPVRLQLSRRRGFNLQELSHATNGLPAINVARPTKWGNPFTVAGFRDLGLRGSDEEAARACVGAFRIWMLSDGRAPASTFELRGKNLACWCKPGAPCHADVLLELANPFSCEEARP